MATMGSWNGFQFVVSPSLVRSFSELTITGGSETEDKVSEKQKYVERLNSTATEISLSVYLNAHLGCNVRSEADGLISAANAGACSYFYVGGKKLVPYKLMLTQAQASEIEISPGGTWIACKVSLTLKQGEKDSGGSGGKQSGSGSQDGKTTVRQESFLQQAAGTITSTVTQIQQTAGQIVASIASKINGATQGSTPAVSAPGSLLQQACEQVSRITAAAQSASKTAASSNPTSSTGMGGRKPITAIDIK